LISAVIPKQVQWNGKVVVVPETGTYGQRKAHNFTVNIQVAPTSPFAYAWALVYVPEGIEDASIKIRPFKDAVPTGFNSIYEPNQHVIASGLLTGTNPVKSFTPSTRSLNSGDAIFLILSTYGDAADDKTDPIIIRTNYGISL
jgi:hypothetical protein